METPDDQPHRPHKTNLPCDSAKAPHFLTTWPRPRPPPHPHVGLTFAGNIRIPQSGPVHMRMSHVAFTCQHARGRQQQTHSQKVMECGHGAQAAQAGGIWEQPKTAIKHLRLLISEDFPQKKHQAMAKTAKASRFLTLTAWPCGAARTSRTVQDCGAAITTCAKRGGGVLWRKAA